MGKTSTSADFYEKPGKRQFTRLILALAAKEDCRSFGGFWGHGGEALEAAAAGLDVLAVDNDESVADEMRTLGAAHGIAVHIGNVRRVKQHCDIWHADFMDTPKPENFKALRHISTIADKWIAVTLATDHIKNTEMQGESLMATLPAWLTFACEGFTLEYFAWYRRHETKGLRMWVALLKRIGGRGTTHRVYPPQIAYSIRERNYWSSRPFYELELLPHRYSPRNETEKAQDAARYQLKKTMRPSPTGACRGCGLLFAIPARQGRRSTTCSSKCKRQLKRQYKREWYLRKKAAVSGTAAEAISSD